MKSTTIKVPFALNGDKAEIPIALQQDKSVSMTAGYTDDYELPDSNPNSKPVGRENMNYLFYNLTLYQKELQENGIGEWREDVIYSDGAIVLSDGIIYKSLKSGNSDSVTNRNSWQTFVVDNIEEKLKTFFSYDPNRLYKPFDRIHFGNGEWYQVYHPDGVIGKDPRDAKNRPSGWTNSDPSQPYYWIKLSETGERGQIGSYVIAQSFERQENWLPAVGGVFSVNAGLFPWLYRANFGKLPNKSDTIKYGVRNNDFMRFISNASDKHLLSTQDDAIRNIAGYIQTVQLCYGPSGDYSGALYNTEAIVTGVYQVAHSGGQGAARVIFDSSRSVPTAEDNRPSNTALTAFLII